MPNLTDEQFQKLLEARAPVSIPAPEAAKDKMATSAIDLIFRSLTGICAGGIGWLVITMPVMIDNIEDLKEDVAKIETQTQDRFTRTDFLTEIEPIVAQTRRNTDRLDQRTDKFSDIFERLTRLEERAKTQVNN